MFVYFQTSSKWATMARSPYFDWVAFGVCVCFIMSIAFDHYMISENVANIVSHVDFACKILFIIETGLRLHSLRREFLMSFWNFYDAIAVILVLIGELFKPQQIDCHSNLKKSSFPRANTYLTYFLNSRAICDRIH